MPSDPGVDHDATRRTVMAAVRDLDGPTVRDALLQSLLTCGVDDTVTEVVMPVLHDVGEGWERGDLGVLHEHFVSSTFRGVLGDLRVPVQGDQVRTIVLACPPHELHDLPLELFGAMLHARSWRVVSLGANTPMSAVGEAVRFLEADACVLAGVRRSAFESRVASLARLGTRVPLFLAGEGALALPSPPPASPCCPATCASRPTLVDAVGALDVAGRARPQRARGRLTRHTVGSMRITHLGHACLLVEMADTRVLVDPGTFADDLSDVRDLVGRARDAPAPRPPRPRAAAGPGRRQPRRGGAVRPGQRRRAGRPRGRGARARRLRHHGRCRHRDPVRPSSTPSSTTTSRASPTSGCASTPRASRRSSTRATRSTPSPARSTCSPSRSRRRGSAAAT